MAIFKRLRNYPETAPISETQKTNSIANLAFQQNLSGLTVSGTIQTTPEWYESLKQTVEYLVDQRIEQHMEQNTDQLKLLIDSIIEDKLAVKIEQQHTFNESTQEVNSLITDTNIIKDIVLKEIKIGQVFYPSEVADKFNLDLIAVMNVLNELRMQGNLKNWEAPDVGSS
jgi:ribosomal protein S25